MNLRHITANRNRVADVEFIRNTETWINGFEAENSILFIWSKGGAGFFLNGGKLAMNKSVSGNYFRTENGGAMSIENIAITNIGSTQQRSEEHTSELQSLMRISYAVFCLKK